MKVVVVPPCNDWRIKFQIEENAIQAALGEVVDKIHHIGSTAVENLAAKPIVDILLEVKSIQALDEISSKIESLEYEAMGEFGIPGRRYFRKGGCNRTHQIHAFEIGDKNIERHIAFRDYLIAFPHVRDAYGDLKIQLALECNDDVNFYCAGKNDFIKFHEANALRWKNS